MDGISTVVGSGVVENHSLSAPLVTMKRAGTRGTNTTPRHCNVYRESFGRGCALAQTNTQKTSGIYDSTIRISPGQGGARPNRFRRQT